MNIIINFKMKYKVRVNSMTFTDYGSHYVVVDAVSIVMEEGKTILKAVSFNEKYANGLGHNLLFSVLQEMDISLDENPAKWVEIESIQIIDSTPKGKTEYIELPKKCFEKFCLRRIDTLDYSLLEEDFQKIAKYVREMDRKEDALAALNNYPDLSKNVKEFIAKERITEFAEDFSSLSDYTGEEELDAIDSFIRKMGGVKYPVFISNIDTEDEIRQTVPILGCHLEKIEEMVQEYCNGGPEPEEIGCNWPVLYDEYGDTVSLQFVNAIEGIN